ncbi:MAG TPA: DUF4157 domain-containing protein [Acidobacteriaceae bacterium]|nr:DUF4157 domain-containing protein [Acidobacteriaceae bacterium]
MALAPAAPAHAPPRQAKQPAPQHPRASADRQVLPQSRVSLSPGGTALPRSFGSVPPVAPGEQPPALTGLRLPLQRKLAIGAIDDPLELEADAMAQAVLNGRFTPSPRSGAPALRRKCACEGSGQPCSHCEKEQENKLHRKASSGITPTEAPPIVHEVLGSPGHPLDPATRDFFEPRFDADLSRVRIHADPKAAKSAAAVHAHAYTVGRHIVFAAGKHMPWALDGRSLLAHELSHVIQQSGRTNLPHDPVLRRAPDLSVRERQLACVVRLGGCASSRDAGIPSTDDIQNYNQQCRADSHYTGADITPTNEECANPPQEPLSTAEKIVLGAFLLLGAAAVVAATIVAGEVIIPVVIASVGEGAQAALAFYLANAIVVNEIGVFAAGLILSCDGDVPGLLRALANDPVQAAQLLAEVYILHVNISIQNGPARRATVPVKLLPADEQTDPAHIKFKANGPPVFEEETQGQPAPSQRSQTTPGTEEGAPTPPPVKTPPPASPLDQAISSAEQELNAERASVAQQKGKVAPEKWSQIRAGATKRLYNLLERRAVLSRMKAFPGRVYAEQAEIVGVESGGQLRPAAAISKSGKGRIADVLEIDGSKATLEDLKSASTQLKSVQGGMSSPDIEAQFRSSSEIEKQHAVEKEIIAEAKRTGGKVIIQGRHPVSGAVLRFSLNPDDISSRVTDYTTFGHN